MSSHDCALSSETKWGLGLLGAAMLGGAYALPSMAGMFGKGIALILIGIIIWYIWCKFTEVFCKIPLIGDVICGAFRSRMDPSGPKNDPSRDHRSWLAMKKPSRMTSGPKSPLRMRDATVWG